MWSNCLKHFQNQTRGPENIVHMISLCATLTFQQAGQLKHHSTYQLKHNSFYILLQT